MKARKTSSCAVDTSADQKSSFIMVMRIACVKTTPLFTPVVPKD